MHNHRPHTALPGCFLILMLSLVPAVVLAAGSGGGGGLSGSTYDNNRRALPPEVLSEKAMRAGIKHRDRALKQEAKAAKAKNDKARDKALARAAKQYNKAIEKQREAIQLDSQNYKAANELGYALRKTGDFRKSIGAYNYALEINPNFYQAIEYRGEALLSLGYYNETQNAYMTLFRNDRGLADQLMERFEAWRAEKGDTLSEDEQRFAEWIESRKRLAEISTDLSFNNTRTW
ncbi:MAG: tetratricopeptide repeat protein [Pseudomonadota bacterium]